VGVPFVPLLSHWSLSLVVKPESGKVERARECRTVVGENRKVAITEIDMAEDLQRTHWGDGSTALYQLPLRCGLFTHKTGLNLEPVATLSALHLLKVTEYVKHMRC
jgi:hypothetical protein